MQLSAIVLFVLHAFAVYAKAASNDSTTAKLEKFTPALGHIVDTTEPQPKVERAPLPDENDVLELDPNDVTPAIPPGTSEAGIAPQHHGHIRGRRGYKRCPFYLPWLCDGVTCMNKFIHNCCTGGHICKDPTLCVRNQIGQIGCR